MKITKRLLLTLCTGVTACAAPPAGPDAGFTPISPQKAKEMMDAGQELLILDVRSRTSTTPATSPEPSCCHSPPSRPPAPHRSSQTRTRLCWSTATAEGAAAKPASFYPSWDIPTSAIWAASWTGPTKKNKKQHKSAGGISAGAFAVLSYKKGKWKAIFPALSGSPVPLPLLPCPSPADSSAFGSAGSRNKVQ